MTKKEIISRLLELDVELDKIHKEQEDLKDELVKKYGVREWDKLFDKLRWTIE